MINREIFLKTILSFFVIIIFYYSAPLVQNKFEDDKIVKQNNGFPNLELYISRESQNLLNQKKENAIKSLGYLFRTKNDYAKAFVKTDQGVKKATVRLKGDWSDHFTGSVMSLRVNIKKGTFLGLNRFTFQAPSTRHGHRGMLLYKVMKKYDTMGIKQVPINLYINNKYRGVMLLESHFSDSRIFELNKRRPGIIFKSYEDFIWKQRYTNKKARQHIFDLRKFRLDNRFFQTFLGNHPNPPSIARDVDFQFFYNNTPFRAFNEDEILKSNTREEDFIKALTRLRSYQEGYIENEEVFDMEKLAYYTVISNMFSIWHGLTFANVKFYWNPYTELFEPVSYDNYVSGKHDRKFVQPFFFRVLTSQKFISYYKKAVQQIETDLPHIIEELKSYEKYLSPIIKNKNHTQIYWDRFQKKFEHIKNNIPKLSQEPQKMEIFNIPPLNLNADIHSPMIFYNTGNSFEIVNTLNVPIEIKSFETNGKNIISNSFSLPPTISAVGKAEMIRKTAGVIGDEVKVQYLLLNKVHLKTFPVLPYVSTKKEIKSCENTALPKFIEKTSESKYIVKQGTWIVNQDICLFDQYSELKIEAGATLIFKENSFLKLKGDIIAIGTESKPITFTSKNKWKGILVSMSQSSKLAHVHFENGEVIEQYPFSGFINFFRSSVDFNNVSIKNINAEDTINLISSRFNIENMNIKNVSSDSIDFDFSNGNISNSNFENIGGDALDFSYATAIIKNSNFKKIADKAISAGESSNLTVEEVLVQDSNTIIASKDSSRVTAKKISGKNLENGILAYKKKGLYSGANIEVENMKLTNVKHHIRCQINSVVSINKNVQSCNEFKVYDSYDLSEVK